MPVQAVRRRAACGVMLALTLASSLAASPPRSCEAQNAPSTYALLGSILREVREIGKYPGDDLCRGDFFLGEGDDDTNKTHHVGIVINDEAGSTRMTIRVTRLEPSREDPRVRYGRDPRMLVCQMSGERAEMLSCDYSPSELEALLPRIVRAVVDKKNLLKGIKIIFP